MPEARRADVSLHYEVEGPDDGPPLLLVMGLGAQMTAWTPEFRSALVARGFRVVHFDNRDVGRSTWFDQAGVPDLAAMLTGGGAPPPYLLADMADDAVAVLDDIGIAAAHVVGASMGGMIAQSIVLGHPDRVVTLTSIMSTTGAPGVGAPHAHVLPSLLRPAPTSPAEGVEASLEGSRLIASPGFPFDEARLRAQAEAAVARAFHPQGTARQLAAIVASPDRTPGLREVRVPTLVIHGEADPLVDVSGGRATAEAIPGARLVTIPGMGHDLPPALYDRVADLIAEVAGLAATAG